MCFFTKLVYKIKCPTIEQYLKNLEKKHFWSSKYAISQAISQLLKYLFYFIFLFPIVFSSDNIFILEVVALKMSNYWIKKFYIPELKKCFSAGNNLYSVWRIFNCRLAKIKNEPLIPLLR